MSVEIRAPRPSAAHQLVREHSWTRLLVNALVVDQALWRQGIGTALLEAAESWGRARGAQAARLDTYIGSAVSVPFYERHAGYQPRSVVFQKALLQETLR
jgi:GNAT superfamily N-acetyltransferase